MMELSDIFDLHMFGTVGRPGPVVPITFWSREQLARYPVAFPACAESDVFEEA